MSLNLSTAPAPAGVPVVALTVADVLRLGQRLPSTPQVFNRIGRLLSDPNSNLDEIVKLVKLDATLALRVLQLSNAAYYGFKQRCGSLDEAINRLGFREVYRQVGVIAAQQLFCGELAVHKVSGQLAWENSISCALAMEWLAKYRHSDDANAYAIGLLRPVGKIVLNRVLIERPTVWCVYPGESAEPAVHVWERRMFGLSAPEVAAILMENWKFPQGMCDAVRHHLEPAQAPGAPVEAYLLNLAGWVAAQLGKGLPGEAGCWQLTPGKLQRTGLTEDVLRECVHHTQMAFDQTKSKLR
ncbi:MAG: HDOD domain-containing protein [Opitutaceae bacterium]|nr:HDOD domain-containing protein [Opitutaceae bacterium]